jgi:hypothetical protein
LSEEDQAEVDRYLAPGIQQRQEEARIRIQQRQEADKISRSVLRAMHAIHLCRSGVSTMAQAASRIETGISERQLRRAFEAVGESPPWSHGGRRPGAGRKSSGHGGPTA